MNNRFVVAALTAALLSTAAQAEMGSGSSSTQSQSHTSGDHVSKDVGTALLATQAAIVKKDTAAAMASIKAAQALPNRTAYDDFNINRFVAALSAGAGDFQTASTAFDAVISSEYFPGLKPDEQNSTYHDATIASENVQHWPQTIQYGQKSEAATPDDVIETIIAIAYYQTKDNTNAQKYAQLALNTAKAAGKQPQANALVIIGNIQGKSDPDAARRMIEGLILTNNDADDWIKIIDDALSHRGTKTIDALYLFRLRDVVGGAAMKGDDYTALASVASQLHLDKEASTVLEQGISSGKLTTGQATGLSSARANAAKDAGVLSAVAAAANKAKTGQDALQLAEDYWGYGRYSDVEAMARMAISKGGLKDPGEATMLLGAVLTVEGKYDEAQSTFGQVSGNEVRTRAAHLWALYAQVKAKGVAAH